MSSQDASTTQSSLPQVSVNPGAGIAKYVSQVHSQVKETAQSPSLPPSGVSTAAYTEAPEAPDGWHGSPPRKKDRLDVHVEKAVERLREADTYATFIRKSRGKGDLHPSVGTLPHPASGLLARYQTEGVPAKMTPPDWDLNRKKMASERGPHKSAATGIDFLREEFADMIDKEQWVVLPLEQVIHMNGLRLSPLGLVPQRGRRDRMICDYSYFGVNDDTDPQAAKEAMQFGRALQRVLYKVHRANPKLGPVYLCKIDLSDGFYRLWVKAEDTIHLAVLLPKRDNETQLVGIPLTNPMGWVESPPNFCTCTETVADLANQDLADRDKMAWARRTPHRLDEISETPVEEDERVVGYQGRKYHPPVPGHHPYRKPVAYWDIYVDDFLGMVQGNKWRRRAVKRTLLHALDRVFRPLEEGDNPHRQEPASIKKMKKGDATWDTKKTILGWDIDTEAKTISLPPHRVLRLKEILHSIRPNQKTIATKDWHKVLGELRSMAMALPGARGLFSLLQEAFRHMDGDRPRLRLSKAVHGFLEDFKALANEVVERPTRIAELIPDPFPATIGACDAAGEGMGGVHFIPHKGGLQPVLWRHRFPKWVQDRLVSFDNPAGDITNSDLELAGSVAQNDILARHADVTERTTLNLYDNTAAVYWQRKGSTTTVGPAAYLLRLQGLHERKTVETAKADKGDAFESDVRLVKEAMRNGVTAQYRARKDKHLKMWHEYCLQENIPPDLKFEGISRDPVEYLQVFGARYRDGRIAPRGKPVQSRTVEDALRSVGQSFSLLGSPDPTKDSRTGKVDFRIRSQLRAYKREDAPPIRVKPLPITIVKAALEAGQATTNPELKCVANMVCIGFFFCLRPGEYTGTTTDDQAFSLDDVTFIRGMKRLDNAQASDEDITQATAVQLRFTTQKNQHKGTIIAHAQSGDPLCCPVASVGRQLIMHRTHWTDNDQPYDGTTKLASYYMDGRTQLVTAKQITKLIRFHARIMQTSTGISPTELSARSLRAGGAMALLMAGCDSVVIKLLARWNSDAMMRYLHQEALPIFKQLAARMYNKGQYTFLSDEWVPGRGHAEEEDDEQEAGQEAIPRRPTTPNREPALAHNASTSPKAPIQQQDLEDTPTKSPPRCRYSKRRRAESPDLLIPPEKGLLFDMRFPKKRRH